jgi:hypothetical protein
MVTGTPQVGQTLTGTNGTWTNNPTSYRYMWTWEDCGTDNTRTSISTVPLNSDIGHQLCFSVWADNAAGESVRVEAALTATVTAAAAFDPSNPAASGYALVFDDEFTSISTIDVNNTQATGYKWYPGNIYGGATPPSYIQVSGGELQLLDDNSGYGQGLSTTSPANNADGFVGRAFGGGAYFEARIKYNPSNINPASGTYWPSFWSDSIEAWVNATHPTTPNSRWNAQWPGQAIGYDNFVEDDFMENPFGNAGYYNGSIHNWYGIQASCGGGWYCDSNNDGGSSNFNNNYVSTPGADFSQYHTYGQLWVAGNSANGGHGFVQYYFDGAADTDKVTWVDGIGSPPPQNQPWQFSVMDNQHMVVVLGTGHNNMGYTVDWVHIPRRSP